MERRVLRCYLELRTDKLPDGSFVSPSSASIYRKSAIRRIDAFMVESAIDFHRKCEVSNNRFVEGCDVELDEVAALLESDKPLTPMCLLRMNEKGLLFGRDGKLRYYHRRFNESGLGTNENTVYNMAQGISGEED